MQSLHTVLTKRFFKQAIIPIFLIEISLILTLFLLNHYQSTSNKEALESITEESFKEIVTQTSDVITNRFDYDKASLRQITEMTHTLFAHTGEFLVDRDAWHFSDGFYQLNMKGKTEEGFQMLPPSEKTSLYTTNLESLAPDDYKTLTAMSLLLPSIQATVDTQNDLISAAWINIDKRYSLAYPPIRAAQELSPNLDVTQYPFYYLADAENNPEREAVFIPLHLESWAIKEGELGAYLSPLYEGERFIGVIGLTLRAEAVAEVIEKMELPFNAYAMLVDSDNNLIVASDAGRAFDAVGIHSFYERCQNSEFHDGAPMKIDLKRLGENGSLLYEQAIPGTNLKLLVSAEKSDIFNTVNKVSSRTVTVGVIFVIGIAVFYMLFSWFSVRSMKRLADTISSPLQAIVAFSSKLGRKEGTALEGSSINEFQELNTNLNKTHEKLLEMVIKDHQTGLYNLNKLLEDLKELSSHVCMRIQLRNYHTLSNLYGQDAADVMITEMVAHLDTYNGITPYRTADDEFTLLCADNDTEALLVLFDELAQLHMSYREIDIRPHLYAGVGLKAPLYEEAGIALLEAQRLNATQPVTSDNTAQTKESFTVNIEWSNRLNHALSEGRLLPYFQPIYNLKTRKIEKFESLVRMVEGDEIIPPFHFLQAAADMGKTHEITKIMIQKVFATASRFPQIGFSINIAFKDFEKIDLPAYLQKCCELLGVPARQITLELLETEAIGDSEQVMEAISRLKQAGFTIAIDDFGTGHSNFAHLLSMQVDFIKIDGSFIKNIAKDPHSVTITKTIAQFASLVGAKTIAEFVADDQVLKRIRQFDIDYAQGYAISPPVAQTQLEALLSKSFDS
ncbi:MAG: EAL domain-containing protein [Sulfurimonadaceae bacterium]|nr:EAL domain-containing protein [Sulfurimonadaceae bacterium]